MFPLPRLGLAHVTRMSDPSPAVLGLLGGFTRRGIQLQHFGSRACPCRTDRAGRVTGLPGRYLDPLLMSPAACREVLRQGSRRCDIAVVEGQGLGRCGPYQGSGFGLGPLAESLDLPVIAIVPCRGWDDLHVTELPEHCDAILLDGLNSPSDYRSIQRAYSLITRKPVIGAVELLPTIRANLKALALDEPVPAEWIEELGSSFLRFADLNAIRDLAESRPLVVDHPVGETEMLPRRSGRVRVAYAYDDAFGLCFPDTLETLDALGAELVECSPLKHASLPESVDVVLLGCGRPEFHIEALGANVSFISALQDHVYQGGRIYAEGGGAAYLARTIWVDGRPMRGAGILPVSAMLQSSRRMSLPTTLNLDLTTWLGDAGHEICGYASTRWCFLDEGDRPAHSGRLTSRGDLVYHRQAIGSMIHIHPAALPDLVGKIARPHRYAFA